MPRLTQKGQVTIPKDVRETLGVRRGSLMRFVRDGDRYYLSVSDGGDPFDRWRGYLKHLGRTTDEIMDEMRGPADP